MNYILYINLIKVEWCLAATIQRAYEEGIRNFAICIPDKYWNGSDIQFDHVSEIKEFFNKFSYTDVNFHFNVLKVNTHIESHEKRETQLRNESLDWIRSLGYVNIMVMDQDELWPVGFMSVMEGLITSTNVDSISTLMTPIVGVPGLPVMNATDKCSVFVRNGYFQQVRSSTSPNTWFFPHLRVFHFTACKPTMKEVADKYRKSAHYNNPDYYIKHWIDNILPYIKPGMRNIHMYRTGETWPLVADWSKDLLSHIPKSLRPYLSV